MKRNILSAAGLVASVLLGSAAAPVLAEDALSTDLFTSYRIEADDCAGRVCGAATFADVEALGSFLADEADRRNSLGQANRARAGNPGRTPQVVFLDFNPSDTTFDLVRTDGSIALTLPSHSYTAAEQAEIVARLEADFARYRFQFTTVRPTRGDYTTLLFNDNDDPLNGPGLVLFPSGGISIGFGLADNIDFRNAVPSDNAGIDANFWEFLLFLDPSGGLLSALSGLPLTTPQELVSTAVVNQSANTAAHELGHILGLRHHDSFGAPGDGLPSTGTPSPLEFVPFYGGPQNAQETILHLMASGASVGLGLSGSTAVDRFLSERSAIKVELGERGRVFDEAAAVRRGRRGGMELPNFVIPNTIETGVNGGTNNLRTSGAVIEGRIDVAGEVDRFRVSGRAGEFLNAEVVSFTDRNVVDPVLTFVAVYLENADGSLSLVDVNAQTFEPFDPLLVDVELPVDGTYVVEVSAPDIVFFDLDGDGIQETAVPLSAIGASIFLTGDYSLLVYSVDEPLGGGN